MPGRKPAQQGDCGTLFMLTEALPSADEATLSLLYRGEKAHSGVDILSFWSETEFLAAKDVGLGSGDDNGLRNDSNNEITGTDVSDGDTSLDGLIHTAVPPPSKTAGASSTPISTATTSPMN